MSKLLHWDQWEADLFEGTPGGGIPSRGRPYLIFNTTFNPNVEVRNQSVGSCYMSGTDNSLSKKNNWAEDYTYSPHFYDKSNKIYYEAGNETQRLASIVPDPTDPKNNVLKFWLKEANGHGGDNGRIQLMSRTTLTDIRCDIKMRLGGWFNDLTTSDQEITWLTLAEFFTQPRETGENQFRIHVALNKAEGFGKPLRWVVEAEKEVETDIPLETSPGFKKIWERLWREAAPLDTPIVLNEFFQLSIWLREGRENGRCKVIMTPSDNIPHSICDKTGYTMHPDDRYKDGYHGYQPLKVYTSPELIAGMQENFPNDAFEIYYDSYKVWANKPN